MTSFEPGDIKQYTRLAWNQMPDISFRIQAVHRLTDMRRCRPPGYVAHPRRFQAFGMARIHLMTIEDERLNRSEMFDETDLGLLLPGSTS